MTLRATLMFAPLSLAALIAAGCGDKDDTDTDSPADACADDPCSSEECEDYSELICVTCVDDPCADEECPEYDEDDCTDPMEEDGSLNYTDSVDGVTGCDLEVDFASIAQIDDCNDCTFAFEVESTITDNQSSEDCGSGAAIRALLAGDEWAGYTHVYNAFWEVYYGYYSNYYNVAAHGYGTIYNGSDYAGPYFSFFPGFDGSENGSAVLNGDAANGGTLTWQWAVADYATQSYYYNVCDDLIGTDPAELFAQADSSDLDCGAKEMIDTWTFTGNGMYAHVSVDTVAADSAFDTIFWVNGEDGCMVAWSDDSVDCTYPPTQYQCSSTVFPTNDGEVYQVVVSGWGSCTGTTAEYALGLEFSADGSASSQMENDLEQDLDNNASGYEVYVEASLDATATISPE